MSKISIRKHGNHKYPWHRWADGRWHTVVSGQHFTCKVMNLRRRLDQFSHESGLPIEIEPVKAGDMKITFRFLLPEVAGQTK